MTEDYIPARIGRGEVAHQHMCLGHFILPLFSQPATVYVGITVAVCDCDDPDPHISIHFTTCETEEALA